MDSSHYVLRTSDLFSVEGFCRSRLSKCECDRWEPVGTRELSCCLGDPAVTPKMASSSRTIQYLLNNGFVLPTNKQEVLDLLLRIFAVYADVITVVSPYVDFTAKFKKNEEDPEEVIMSQLSEIQEQLAELRQNFQQASASNSNPLNSNPLSSNPLNSNPLNSNVNSINSITEPPMMMRAPLPPEFAAFRRY